MSRLSRSIFLSAIFLASPLALAAPSVDAITDAAAAAEVENSKFQFEGEVNGNDVYVRSGPSDNDYATAKLNRGDKVTVVGIKFEWLKILPPEGSFCYVAKAYVEKRNDGSVGRVTNTLNVRVGSNILPMKTKVATKLEPGQDVQILGEQDEYFKVKPPSGVYFYINKQFVDPVRRVDVPNLVKAASPAAEPPTEQPLVATQQESTTTAPPSASITPAPPAETADVTPARSEPAPIDVEASPSSEGAVAMNETSPSTQPAEKTAVAEAHTDSPSTQPTIASADVEFDRLETELRAASKLPLTQQPVAQLLEGYQKLVTAPDLPESMRRIAEHRVQTLTVHNQSYQMAMAHQAEISDRDAKRRALQAEGDELMERLKKTGIIFYSALGTIRPSTLQGGEGKLYRLTDPLTGRTVVYLRSSDENLARMNGLFVGVQGEIIDDPQMKLKFITPTSIEPVDQRNVNRSITAKITPPSLQPGGILAGQEGN